MRIIKKYKLVDCPAKRTIPMSSQILSVIVVDGDIYVLIEIDTEEQREKAATFIMVREGELIPDGGTIGWWSYVGTVVVDSVITVIYAKVGH